MFAQLVKNRGREQYPNLPQDPTKVPASLQQHISTASAEDIIAAGALDEPADSELSHLKIESIVSLNSSAMGQEPLADSTRADEVAVEAPDDQPDSKRVRTTSPVEPTLTTVQRAVQSVDLAALSVLAQPVGGQDPPLSPEQAEALAQTTEAIIDLTNDVISATKAAVETSISPLSKTMTNLQTKFTRALREASASSDPLQSPAKSEAAAAGPSSSPDIIYTGEKVKSPAPPTTRVPFQELGSAADNHSGMEETVSEAQFDLEDVYSDYVSQVPKPADDDDSDDEDNGGDPTPPEFPSPGYYHDENEPQALQYLHETFLRCRPPTRTETRLPDGSYVIKEHCVDCGALHKFKVPQDIPCLQNGKFKPLLDKLHDQIKTHHGSKCGNAACIKVGEIQNLVRKNKEDRTSLDDLGLIRWYGGYRCEGLQAIHGAISVAAPLVLSQVASSQQTAFLEYNTGFKRFTPGRLEIYNPPQLTDLGTAKMAINQETLPGSANKFRCKVCYCSSAKYWLLYAQCRYFITDFYTTLTCFYQVYDALFKVFFSLTTRSAEKIPVFF